MKKNDPYAGLYIEEDVDPYAGLFIEEVKTSRTKASAYRLGQGYASSRCHHRGAAALRNCGWGLARWLLVSPTAGLGAPFGARRGVCWR
jgi:hypothetical protein